MIVLPSSSQVVYTIEDNRYSCYDNDENRKIASLIVEGEMCDTILYETNKEVRVLLKANDDLKKIVSQLRFENSDVQLILDDCLISAEEYQTAYVEVADRNTKLLTWLKILSGALVIETLLFIIIIL